jgi:hypothetical protein
MHPEPTHREAPWLNAQRTSGAGAAHAWHRSSWVGRSLAVLALASVLFGRALVSALPGTRAGIDRWIVAVSSAASVSSQLLVVFGLSAMVTLLFGSLWQRRVGTLYRILALPSGAALVVFVALSTLHRLEPVELTTMAIAAIALATVSALSAISSPASRAAGLVLLISAFASLCYLVARVLMLEAVGGAPISFGVAARTSATLAFAADLGALALAMGWLSVGNVGRILPILGVATALATFVTWGALVGSNDGAAMWQLVALRALNELTPSPAPWITVASRYWVEAFSFLVAALVALYPRRAMTLQLAVAFALLSRGSADVPGCAMLLAMAALLAPIVADGESSSLAGG